MLNLRRLWTQAKTSPIGRRLASAATWSLAGSIASRVVMLAAWVIAGRILGRDLFGRLGILQSTVGMFGVFAGFGLSLTAAKHVAEFRKADPQRAGRIMSLSGLMAAVSGSVITVVMLLAAPWLARETLNAPELTDLLRISCLMLVLGAQNGAQTGALTGFEAFRSIAVVNFLTSLLSFPLLVAGARLGGLNGAVWALVANLAINWAMNHAALRMHARKAGVPFRMKGCFAEWRVLLAFSVPALLSGAMVSPANWLVATMLVRSGPDGFEQMGMFNAANQWRLAIVFLPSMLAMIVLPILSSLRGEGSHGRYRKVLWYNVALTGVISLAVACVVSLLSPFIMASYGSDFAGGFAVLIALSFSAAIMAVSSVIGQALASSGKMWLAFWINGVWAVLLITLTWLFLPLGSAGLALAYLISYAIHFVVMALISWRLTNRLQGEPGVSTLTSDPAAAGG